MDAARQLRRLDAGEYLRAQDSLPERLGGGGPWDGSWAPSDAAEAAVWARLPVGTYAAVTFEQATDIPGLTAQQARMALLSLVMGRKARAWPEAPGLHLVARGPFRQCDRCGSHCAPGPCLWCGFDPSARAEAS